MRKIKAVLPIARLILEESAALFALIVLIGTPWYLLSVHEESIFLEPAIAWFLMWVTRLVWLGIGSLLLVDSIREYHDDKSDMSSLGDRASKRAHVIGAARIGRAWEFRWAARLAFLSGAFSCVSLFFWPPLQPERQLSTIIVVALLEAMLGFFWRAKRRDRRLRKQAVRRKGSIL